MNVNDLLKELLVELECEFRDNFTGLVLFGSYAKNTQNNYSDIDILVIFKELPKSRIKRNELLTQLLIKFEDKYKKEINAIIGEENKLSKTYLLLDIADYAKIIIDKNKNIKKIFNSIKKDYKNNLAKKIPLKDHYMLWSSENLTT